MFRSQTTKGIWLARCVEIEPSTLVLDLEGTDGRERGEVVSKSLCNLTYLLVLVLCIICVSMRLFLYLPEKKKN